jgi:type VI protein secretion system component Hcp
MDNAQVYLSLVRPTMIPIAGECAADLPFTGQIELHGWSWNIINQDEAQRAKDAAKPYERSAGLLATSGSRGRRIEHATTDMRKELAKLMKQQREASRPSEMSEADFRKQQQGELEEFETNFKRQLADINGIERAKTAEERESEAREAEVEELDRNKNYEFSFSKRVDLASTQMLNSMKSGDVFPTGVLTIHQSSANAGLSLVVTVQKVRLIDYALKVEVSDTMTDMREEWTAEFAALAYVYKNRKTIDGSSDAGQAVAKGMSQGQVRAFAMKNLGSPI